MKRWIAALLCGLLVLGLTACGQSAEQEDDGKLHVVATIFPAYDFARAAGGDDADVTLLLPPGAESHSYEPTPADILAVQECDLFIYLGGESDAWVDTILDSVERTGATLRMVDCVDLLEEETVEGMQEEPGHDHEDHDLGEVKEIDEHVWTSPVNAAAITRTIGDTLAELDRPAERRIRSVPRRMPGRSVSWIRTSGTFFATAPRKTIVFGDRFPIRYFAEEYDLDYYAAFPGCSTQTEPSAATIAFLTEKVEAEQIPTVWYIEFSNHLVADSIAEAAGAEKRRSSTPATISPRTIWMPAPRMCR